MLENNKPKEELYKIITENTPAMIWVSNTEKLYYFFNTSLLNFIGYIPDEDYESSWMPNIHPDDLKNYLITYNSSFDAKEEFKIKHRLKRHDGQYRWLLNHGVPQYNIEGIFTGYIGSCIDINELLETDCIENIITEAQKNVTKLKVDENENRLRSLVLNANYSLMILQGEDFVVEIANQEVATLWNKTLDEIIGRKLLDILPEIKDQPFPALLKEVFEKGKPYSQDEEVFHLHADGDTSLKYVSFSYDPIFDNNNKVTAIIVSAENITEKVLSRLMLERSETEQQLLNENLSAANEELAAMNEELYSSNEELLNTQQSLKQTIFDLAISEARFRSLVQYAPVPICIFQGLELIFESANNQMLKLIGKSADIIGKPLAEAVPELNGQPFFQLLDNVFKTGEIYYGNEFKAVMEHQGKLLEGYYNFIYQPIKDDNEATTAVMVVAIDVTEQVNSRKKVEQAEESLRMATDSAGLAPWFVDARTGEFTYSNRFKEIFGFRSDEELPSNSVIDQIIPEHQLMVTSAMEAAITKGEPVNLEYLIARNSDGKRRWIRSVGKMVIDNLGMGSYITGVLHDITEQKQDEIRKNDFIAMVSHELKTPLTSLTAIIQIANNKVKKYEDLFLAGAMDKANIHVKKMSNMINGFLNISRLESGKLLMVKQIFNLEDLLLEMIEEIKVITTSHTISYQQNKPLIVNADKDKLGSVISNLLSNAIKYSPKGKVIEVRCWSEENQAIVSIKDQGIGIKPQDAGKLFERYYRVESDNTQHISGFGIGLYLSAEIINRHQGKIWVESEVSIGATFYFSLPLLT